MHVLLGSVCRMFIPMILFFYQIGILCLCSPNQVIRRQYDLLSSFSGGDVNPVEEHGGLIHEVGNSFFMPIGEQPPRM